jgi:hypothetical protein
VIGGHEVPEAVITTPRKGTEAEVPEEAKEEEPEIAGAKRRSARPVAEPEKSA